MTFGAFSDGNAFKNISIFQIISMKWCKTPAGRSKTADGVLLTGDD